MVFSAALEKKGDDDDPKAVEKRFGRRSVQFLGETVQIIALLWSKETTTSGYLLEKKTLRESSYFFFLEKTFFAWGVKETPSFLSHHHGK